VDIWFVCCDGEFACLLPLLLAFYGGSRSLALIALKDFMVVGNLWNYSYKEWKDVLNSSIFLGESSTHDKLTRLHRFVKK
jgi:hypothetical protein